MTIVIFSSVFNHHSLPLCDALYKLCQGNFYFVETMEEEQQRRELGYHTYDRAYVINMLSSDDNKLKAKELALTADVMIAGVFPYEFLSERLKYKKLTFLCQERMFKGGASIMRRARAWFFNVRKYLRFKNSPLYFLSIGKGAAEDYKSIGFYKNKKYLWGYFPPFIKYDPERLMGKKRSETVDILFVGRLIEYKHPEYSLKATKMLLSKGYNVTLTYIGCGEMEKELRESAKEFGEIRFLGSMSPEQVREYMADANVFTFTSNSLEGWGAVVNEAMNSCCAVIASDEAGASSTLIEDGKNGFLFKHDDFDEFYRKLELLVSNRELIEAVGKEAYNTIANDFNAEIAADRLYNLSASLLNGESPLDYSNGILKKL